jgi:hypothetical protein
MGFAVALSSGFSGEKLLLSSLTLLGSEGSTTAGVDDQIAAKKALFSAIFSQSANHRIIPPMVLFL